MQSEIIICRDIPIVAGYVRPNGTQENGRNDITVDAALDALPNAVVTSLSAGSGASTGGKSGAQRFLRVETPLDCCAVPDPDPQATIATPAADPPSYPL
jgi:hypothetical protein